MSGVVIDRPVARARSRLRTLDVLDVVFAVTVVATVVAYTTRAHQFTYVGDDWRLALRGNSLGDYFQPYNNHLSIVPIAGYRLIYLVFGFRTYVALFLVGVISGAAIAVAAYLTVRSRVGTAPALVAGVALLWYPDNILLPAAFNHYLAMTAVFFCAWELSRDRPQSDLPLALGLSFALICSGVSVAGAAGCLTYVALTRPPARRWLAVVLPTAAWFAWWILISHRSHSALPLSFASQVAFVRTGIIHSFYGLVGGNPVLGTLLALAFVANLGWQLRRGPRHACHELAWTVGLVAWWVGLAQARGRLDSSLAFRYQLIGSSFVVLAFLPRRRIEPLPAWLTDRVTKCAAVLVGLLLIVANAPGIFPTIRHGVVSGGALRQVQIAASLGPKVVPDKVLISTGILSAMPASQYRQLIRRYGAPAGTTPADPDAAIVADGIGLTSVKGPPSTVCTPITGPISLGPASSIKMRAPADAPVVVELRRFGTTWATVASIPAGRGRRLDLPGLNSPVPWEVRATGACRLPD
jgi:hypothetical protein